MDSRPAPMKVVYTVVERTGGKSFWVRIGAAFICRDGSINVKLDALPLNGSLQIRDAEARTATAGGASPRTDQDDIPF